MIDGYHKWLGIPKDQRPPTHYQLLGIAPDEQDAEVIETAAVRQVAFVRNFQAGPHAEQCSRILTELAEARLTLLNPAKRKQYDARLATATKPRPSPPRSDPERSGDELASLSSLFTEVQIAPADRESNGVRPVNRGQRKGWSSLAIAMQCGLTGFTLVAAYYLLQRWPKAPSPPTAATTAAGLSAAGSTEGSSFSSPSPSSEIAKTDAALKAAIWEVVFEPADATFLTSGADVHVIDSAPGRRLVVIDDPELKKPRSLKISHDEYQTLTLELASQPGGRTRTHVELQTAESPHISSQWGVDARNLVPFPAPPLSLAPPLASSDAEQATPSPSELEIRWFPPELKLQVEGMDAESEPAGDGERRYRFPGADGSRTVRIQATLPGYKPVERTLTPLPGERRALSLRLEAAGSKGESTAHFGSIVALPPIPAATWAEYRVHLDPVPRTFTAVASGLKALSYRIERGVHLYQITAPDGRSPIKFHYSAPGFKPLETALTPHPGERQDVTFHFAASGSSDGSRIIRTPEASSATPAASPARRPEVRLIDKELRRFEGSLARVEAVVITPDGKRALAAGADGRIRIYDPASGRLVHHIQAHKDAVLALAIAPSGQQVLSAGKDTVVRLWDITSGHSAGAVFPGCTVPVVCVAFTPDGDHVCAGDAQGFRFWNVGGPSSARRFPLASETAVVALTVTPQNDSAYAGRSDRVIACDLTSGSAARQIGPTLADARLTALDLAPGGKRLILGCSDGTLRLWDVPGGGEIRRFEKHDGRVNSAQFSSDGKTIVSGGGTDDQTIRLWDVNTGSEIARFKGHSQAVTRVVFTPGDRQLLSGSLDRTVRLWDVPK